jgi:integrase
MQRKIDAGLSSRTVRYCHAVIRSALTRAAKDGLVARNVAMLADPPALDKRHRVEPLTPEDARRFLAVVSGHRLEALYSVAIAVGLRRGEALGLEWVGVDLERGVLQVTQTIQPIRKKGMVTRRAGKNDKSLRMIPLPGFAIAALSRHREIQAQERAFAGEDWKERGLVFTTTIGTPLQPGKLLKHFHGALETLKIDRRRFHDLRHTAASLLLAQGATLHEVKEILGHSQIALTADLYGHAYTSVLRGTVDRVGSLLAPQNPVAPQLAPLAATSKPN